MRTTPRCSATIVVNLMKGHPQMKRFTQWLCSSFAAGIACATGQSRAQDSDTAPALAGASIEELMNVRVTTVSRGESTVGQSPAAVFVITPEMIRRSGATTFPEILRMVPGVSVAHIDGNKWTVSARGFNDRFGNKLLVQMDGRTVYNALFPGVYWADVDYVLADIDRIEVIRGPGASVWGANAVNGIVNIITKSAKDTHGGLVSGGAGTQERGFASIRFGGQIGDDLHYRVLGKWAERDEQFSLDDRPNDQWITARTGLRLDWTPTSRDTLTFDGGYFYVKPGNNQTFASRMPPAFSVSGIESEIARGGHALARWTRQLDAESSFALQVYWDRLNHDSTKDFTHFRIETYDVDFQHLFPLGERQKVTWGLGYRFTNLFLSSTQRDGGFVTNAEPEKRDTNVFSAFVQDEIALVPKRFSLTLGSKFERNDFTGFEYQPTGRLLWTPTARQSAWLAVSRGVRTPGFVPDELEFTLLPFTPGVPVFPRLTGNTALKSEKLTAFELGYRAQASERFSFDIATFYNIYDDLIVQTPQDVVLIPGGAVVPIRQGNNMEGETYGVEVSATWQVSDWWRLQGSYSFLQMQLHAKTGGQNPGQKAALNGQDYSIEHSSPQNQAYVRSSFDLPGHVELDLIGRYVDSLAGFTPGIKGYIACDARLAWKPRENLEFAIVGQNLLDAHHPENGTNPLVKTPLVEIRRGVYAEVTLRW